MSAGQTPYPRSLERFRSLRQSRLATFDRCALSAHFDEEYRHDWSSHPQVRGQVIHRVIAKALRQMHALGERTIETDVMVSILDETLRMGDIDLDCPICPEPIVERRAGKITCRAGHVHRSDFGNLPMSEIRNLRWVAVKWAADCEFDIQNLIDVEQRLRGTLSYPDGLGGTVERELTGALDALFLAGDDGDAAVVLDWKDTWGMPGPTDMGFDGYFQQRFYAWLVFVNYPTISKVTLREHYLRYSEHREATVFRSDIEDVVAELSALAERFDRAFEEENFPPSPGIHCYMCPRPTLCPIFPDVRGEGAIENDAMAARYAKEALVADAALGQRKKALKAWTSVTTGGIEISTHKGQRVWGWKPTKRTERPTRDKIEAAIRINGGQVTPAVLDELYVKRTSSRFDIHTPSEVEDVADDAKLMQALSESVMQTEKQPGEEAA